MNQVIRRLFTICCLAASLWAQQYQLNFSHEKVAFGSVLVGQVSKVHKVRITNTGTDSVALSMEATPSQFQQTNTCSVLAPGAHCDVFLTFMPTSKGKISGSLTITVSAGAMRIGMVQIKGTAE